MRRLVAFAAVLAIPSLAAADELYKSKKDKFLEAKREPSTTAPKKFKRAVGKPPAKLINLYNTWTREWLALDAQAPKIDKSVASSFLRCHFTNEPTGIDERLLPTVVAAANFFGVARVDVVSGFRHAKYNLMLRKKGREVARDSQHSHGTAIDFSLPGIAIKSLHQWAVSQKMGGVGLYLGSGFIHMDTGRIRYWGGE
jgi:uncharacterized protein YcbK (DUF882 family)